MEVFERKVEEMKSNRTLLFAAAVGVGFALAACPTSTSGACKTRADCAFGELCTDGKCVAPNTGGGTATGGGTPTGGGAPMGGGTATVDGGTGGGTPAGQIIDVNADVTASTTWTKGNTYVLKKLTYVDNATLTIEAGTTVLGDKGSALIVTRSGRLEAVGTVTEPIVFSANFPSGTRGGGTGKNWGGIVLLGKAAINVPGGTNLMEGLAKEERNNYGGGATADNAHNCGTLKYVRIEFAGEPLDANNELNSLSLAGCGTGTTIDYVQVHRGIDDGVEVFGGSVNLKHIVASGSDDDGLDWDFGWTGKVQYLVVQQTAGFGNHGIEADSNKSDNTFTPRSNPTLYNVSLIGRKPDNVNGGEGTSRGFILRTGTAGKLSNFIVTNFTDFSMFVDGPSCAEQWTKGDLSVKNSIFFGNGTADFTSVPSSPLNGVVPAPDLDEGMALQAAALSNRSVDPMLEDALNVTAPNFKPKTGSPALMGGATPPSDGFFDATATFVGAVGATDWTKGWTAYPAN
jgi:hypothetical protein